MINRGERDTDRHPRRSTAEVVFVEKNMPMQSKRSYKLKTTKTNEIEIKATL
jgi:hypothetical protein